MNFFNNTFVSDIISDDVIDTIFAHKTEILIIVIVLIFLIILLKSKKKQGKLVDGISAYKQRLDEINSELGLILKEKTELVDFYRKRAVYLRDKERALSKEYNERLAEMKRIMEDKSK